jgi:mannose-6-phosphate isomerase-like protein (cupin superfamily)
MKIVSLTQIAEEGVSHDPEIKKKVLLRNGEVPHLTNFAKSTLLPGQKAGCHTHADMFEIFLVDAGEALAIIEDVPRHLATGDCLVVEPGETHEIFNAGEEPLLLTYFGIAQ